MAGALCYDWGFGLAARFAEFRPWWVIGAWTGSCALFMRLALGWLRRFDRGPLELAWHRAYLAPQPRRANGQLQRQPTGSAALIVRTPTAETLQ